jgi:hypothetical protein
MNKLFRPSPVLLAFTLLYIVAAAASAAREKVIKIETSIVNLDVVVTFRHEPRAGVVAKGAFDVYESGDQKEITHIATDELPLRVSLVFDLSVSMESFVPAVKEETTNLLAKLVVDDKS